MNPGSPAAVAHGVKDPLVCDRRLNWFWPSATSLVGRLERRHLEVVPVACLGLDRSCDVVYQLSRHRCAVRRADDLFVERVVPTPGVSDGGQIRMRYVALRSGAVGPGVAGGSGAFELALRCVVDLDGVAVVAVEEVDAVEVAAVRLPLRVEPHAVDARRRSPGRPPSAGGRGSHRCGASAGRRARGGRSTRTPTTRSSPALPGSRQPVRAEEVAGAAERHRQDVLRRRGALEGRRVREHAREEPLDLRVVDRDPQAARAGRRSTVTVMPSSPLSNPFCAAISTARSAACGKPWGSTVTPPSAAASAARWISEARAYQLPRSTARPAMASSGTSSRPTRIVAMPRSARDGRAFGRAPVNMRPPVRVCRARPRRRRARRC